MTMTQKVVGVLVVAAVVIAVLYYGGKIKYTPGVAESTTTSTSATVADGSATNSKTNGAPIAKMVTEAHNQKDAHKSYTMTSTYPQSSVTVLPEIYNFVQNAKQQFLDDYNSVTDAEAADFPAEASAYNFTVTTRVATSTNTVTYILDTYQYEGGAHGGTTVTTFTYDKTGKLVTLDNVFAKPYLPTLSSLSSKHFFALFGNDAQDDMIKSGTAATADNFSSWYLTSNTITFIFGEYQVASYAAGILEYAIPKSAVTTLLSTPFK